MTGRLLFATQGAAQTFANAVHTRLIAQNRDYANSVLAGKTTAWAIPYQDGAEWCVNVKERCDPVLTSLERNARVAVRA